MNEKVDEDASIENISRFLELSSQLEHVVKLAKLRSSGDIYRDVALQLVVGIRASVLLTHVAVELGLVSEKDGYELQDEMVRQIAEQLKIFKEGDKNEKAGFNFNPDDFVAGM